MVTLFEGDALAGLLSVPTDSVDVCLMDPPYCAGGTSEADRTGAKGQGLRSETIGRDGWFVGDNMGTAGLAMLLRSVACECVRIVKETGHILVFCDWRMVVNIAPAIESAGLRFQNLVVWNKPSAGLGTGFRAKHELILHLTRGRPQFYRNNAGNVIDGSRINARTRKHPTEKPVELLKELL